MDPDWGPFDWHVFEVKHKQDTDGQTLQSELGRLELIVCFVPARA